MNTIKSCPFCGSNEVKIKEDQDFVYYGGAYFVECKNYKARSKTDDTIEEAVIAWDFRGSNA